MKRYTQILADYLSALKYEDIPAEVLERAKLVTLHTIGAAISSLRSKSAQDIIRIAKELGGCCFLYRQGIFGHTVR
jgi:2-methylcitrate dehydratase PrpD